MLVIRNRMVVLFGALSLHAASFSLLAAPSYQFVEGYNVLDDANSPGIGALFAATAGQERDIAVDAARGIIYMARGSTVAQDRAGGVAGVVAIIATNGALAGSNFKDTGILINNGGAAISFQQSIAFDKGSDKLWVLGGGAVPTPTIYSAPGGSLGGGTPAATSAVLVPAFRVDTNLTDVGVYSTNSTSPARGGSPRGLAVRTANGVTTVYVGMGNHVQAWSNDQPLTGTNSPWRRIWATLRPPAGNLASARVITTFTGVNGLAVDDDGNCFFSVQQSGGRLWCVRPELITSVPDKFALDYNDLAFGGTSEREIISVLIDNTSLLTTPAQSITFARFGNQKSLFVSALVSATQRGVTRLDIDDNFSFTNSGAVLRAHPIDGFGLGQPAGGQDSILAGLRSKQASAGQPQGTTTGLLYTDVDSITNPTYIYAEAFVTDTNKGQTIPTAAVIKVRILADTNPPSITSQPQSQTLLEGGTIGGLTGGIYPLSVAASGAFPLSYQWQTNGVDLPGATSSTLLIPNATTNQSGPYRVIVTNALGSITSSVATVTINPLVRSAAMTHLWSNAPGSRPYLTTDSTQRGITYNPTTFSVLIVSRTPALGVYVLDSESGADLYQLGTNGISGGTLSLSKISAADDGQIYAANLAQNGENFRIYRWAVEEANTTATVAFNGNPTPGVTNRWGDTFDVRGSGNSIQILASTRNSNVVAIFTTLDQGVTFSATPITVTDAPGENFGLGLAWGSGNTFWTKGDGNNPLRQVQFDLGTSNGTTLHSYASGAYISNGLAIAIETNLNLLGAISIENPDNLRLYTTFNLANPPVLIDQELFPTDNENAFGTGALDFGGGKLFAIDSNNGILAMTLGTISQPPGAITILRNGASVDLSWSGLFTLQASTNVVGPYVDITSPTNSYSENTAGRPERYFRLRN